MATHHACVPLSKRRQHHPVRSTCAASPSVRSSPLGADTVCKSGNSSADALFTQGLMALMQPIICCVRAQSAREFVTVTLPRCASRPSTAVARLLAREQLPRHLFHKSLLLAPQRKRSSAPDPACEANTEDTVRYGLCAFFSHIPYSQVCAHEVHGWAPLESGKAGGVGANSSWYGGCSAHQTYGQARHSCCLARNAPIGARAWNLK
jgi:hypothetical protein